MALSYIRINCYPSFFAVFYYVLWYKFDCELNFRGAPERNTVTVKKTALTVSGVS